VILVFLQDLFKVLRVSLVVVFRRGSSVFLFCLGGERE
jgi:hypothetical protein